MKQIRTSQILPILIKMKNIIRDFSKSGKQPILKAVITKITSDNRNLRFSGTAAANFPISTADLIIRKFRQEQTLISSKASIIRPGIIKRLGMFILFPNIKIYLYSFTANIIAPWEELPSSIYTLKIKTERITAPTSLSLKTSPVHYIPTSHSTVYFYRDPAIIFSRMELYHFAEKELEELRHYVRKDRKQGDPVRCIIGEYTNSARDNGLAFFKEVQKQQLEVEGTYIIERSNLDNFTINQKDVLEFGSLDHIKACLDTDIIAFTHHSTYVYPHILKYISPDLYASTPTLCLKHGVTALKSSIQEQHSKERVNYTGLCICSQREQSIFVNHFGYKRNQVYITGFPRHDQLYRKSIQSSKKQHILVFPTWRKQLDILSLEEAARTLFVHKWTEALDTLRINCQKPVVMMLHPIIQRLSSLFEDHADKVISAANFQEALINSCCLITDYSSVCFEALYINKPNIFYNFDFKELGINKNAYIDIETELPGILVKDMASLMNVMHSLEQQNWETNTSEMREKYFSWSDDHNAKRVAEVIKTILRDNVNKDASR